MTNCPKRGLGLDRSTITSNSYGGSIYTDAGTNFVIRGSTISDNVTPGSNGGIRAFRDAEVVVSGSRVVGMLPSAG